MKLLGKILLGLVAALALVVVMIRIAFAVLDPVSSPDSLKGLSPSGTVIENYQCSVKTHNVHFIGFDTSHAVTVLFVHGSPGSANGWSGLLTDSVLLQHVNTLAIDRPGYGLSEGGGAVTSLAMQAEVTVPILSLMKKRGKVILVGHSYGGPVVARMAMDYPQLVDGLIIVAGSVDPELEKPKWYNEMATKTMVQWLLPHDMVLSNHEIMPLKQELELMDDRWSEITQPVSVIQGLDDELVPPGNADYLARKLVNASSLEVVELPNTGHLIPWQKPEAIKYAIYDMIGVDQE